MRESYWKIDWFKVNDGSGSEANQQPKMTEQELEEMIDPIFRDDDLNHDGYIDFFEFTKSQEKTRKA